MHHVVFLSLDSCYMQVTYASCCLPQSRQLLHAGHICIMLSSSAFKFAARFVIDISKSVISIIFTLAGDLNKK